MGHGQPDYGIYKEKRTTYGLDDMGELAARLGSIDTFDRGGDIVWLDDFESDVLKWRIRSDGDRGSVVSSAESARSGGFSAKLTTGDQVNDWVRIDHHFGSPTVSRIGFEISFTLNDNFSYLEVIGQAAFDELVRVFRVQYYPATDTLRYQITGGGWAVLTTSLNLYAQTYMFHTLKVVLDLDTNEYVRLIINDTLYPVAGIACFTFGGPPGAEVIAGIQVFTAVASNQSNYVDDAIITQNEP